MFLVRTQPYLEIRSDEPPCRFRRASSWKSIVRLELREHPSIKCWWPESFHGKVSPSRSGTGHVWQYYRGKMLGGSSGINGMAWVRASSHEYDAWAEFAPALDWNWDGLLPFFKKSETLATVPQNPYPGITEEESQHATQDLPRVDGFSGPISVIVVDIEFCYPTQPHSTPRHLTTHFISTSFPQLSTRWTPWDLPLMRSRWVLASYCDNTRLLIFRLQQSGNNIGVTNVYAAVDRKNGVRSYSATAYYCQAPVRPNLHILTGAQVFSLVFYSFKVTELFFSRRQKYFLTMAHLGSWQQACSSQ